MVGQDPVARLDACSSQDGDDGGAVDVIYRCQRIGGFAGEVALDDLVPIGFGQSGLFCLSDGTVRWDGRSRP